MSAVCAVHDLGVIEFTAAWRIQEQWAGEIARGARPATLLLLEHPHTYTFGRQGNPANLLWTPEQLAANAVSVHWVDRGGDITYHGPGQLVGYPLLPLLPGGLRSGEIAGPDRLPHADFVGYLRKLELTLLGAVETFGVIGLQIPGLTGVWAQGQPPAKLAAIGVKVDAHGVSRHGFALNVAPEMHYWQGLIGCGLKDYPVTCLAELCAPVPDMQAVKDAVTRAFGAVFGYSMGE